MQPQSAYLDSQTILFFRNFQSFSGGHLKHWDYFNHVFFSRQYCPYIYFTPETVWDIHNPWLYLKHCQSISQQIVSLPKPRILFVEGVDWPILDEKLILDAAIPIINLIQHVRHAYPDDVRYQFLKNKAIRICVSKEIEAALEDSAQVNGSLFTIPCGLDVSHFPKPNPVLERAYDLLIVAVKEPRLGVQVKHALGQSNRRIKLLTSKIPRAEFLQYINRSKVTLFLPNQRMGEGFYLPALEGMALKTIVVCPDCVGNRSFCLPQVNCFRPAYQLSEILGAVDQALKLAFDQQQIMISRAQQTVAEHSLFQERRSFLDILENINYLW